MAGHTAVVVSVARQAEAHRRENQLVERYGAYLRDERGLTVDRLQIPLEAASLFNDVYVEARRQLVEAKGEVTREAVRMAIGQLADYVFLAEKHGYLILERGVLLPERPPSAIVELLDSQGISVVWEQAPGFFFDNAGGRFT